MVCDRSQGYLVSNLAGNTAYRFQMQALNSEGAGDLSSWSPTATWRGVRGFILFCSAEIGSIRPPAPRTSSRGMCFFQMNVHLKKQFVEHVFQMDVNSSEKTVK